MIYTGYDAMNEEDILLGLPLEKEKLSADVEYTSKLTADFYVSTGFVCSEQPEKISDEENIVIIKKQKNYGRKHKGPSSLF